ncbi:MAG: hypothetical protein Q9195_007878 [Heterodermia aff. obscurata]
MPPPSRLLALPTELRREIWRLLFPPHDIIDIYQDLDWSYDPYELPPDINDPEREYPAQIEIEPQNETSDPPLTDSQHLHLIRSSPAFPLSIHRANHQLHTECSLPLSTTRLHFHIPPRLAALFLALRPAHHRAQIHHLGFGARATCLDDDEVQTGWEAMYTYIAREPTIDTVTIWVPTNLVSVDASYFFWPALNGLVRLLLSGHLDRLRLLIALALRDPRETVFGGFLFEPVTLPMEEVLEELFVVDQVLYDRTGTQYEDAGERWRFEHCAFGNDDESYLERLDEREKRERRLGVRVGREDGVGGGEGTVVVLRREG